jgi:hypothetical protein
MFPHRLGRELLRRYGGANVRFDISIAQSRQSASVKSFGRRQASESPRRANPRAACGALWYLRIPPARAFSGARELFGMTCERSDIRAD